MYLAIDPGLKGAVCIFDEMKDEIVLIKEFDNDVVALLSTLLYINKIKTVYIEDVHGRGGNSAQSNFTFGFNYGQIHAILECFQLNVVTINPRTWQKAMGISDLRKSFMNKISTKECAFKIYQEMKLPEQWVLTERNRVKDGCVDAALIAIYASKFLINKD